MVAAVAFSGVLAIEGLLLMGLLVLAALVYLAIWCICEGTAVILHRNLSSPVSKAESSEEPRALRRAA